MFQKADYQKFGPIADYIAGQSVTDIKKGIFVSPGRPEQISRLITPDSLRYWHEKMIEERKKRQNYGTRWLIFLMTSTS